VSIAARNAAVADLLVTLTGGNSREAVPMSFSVSLNAPLARTRARLIDEGTRKVVGQSTRRENTLTWSNIPVLPPGPNRRIFRITNVRANASGIGVSTTPVPIVATVSVSAAFRIPLTGATQNVAVARLE
jgi:hypothetical protein